MRQQKYLIVGAGFSGSVLARELVENSDVQIDVIDSRDHVAGNCHTARDTSTGVMKHVYGPHIFNTNNEFIWDYVRKFSQMMPFVNRVKSNSHDQIYSLPINLHTINQFFGMSLNPSEAKLFISKCGDDSIHEPKNFEEQALKFIGRDLYNAFFYGYTKKQWGCEPTELPASILKRLPIRFNYDDNYYNSKFQGIPRHGYTDLIEKILEHPKISIKLNTIFSDHMQNLYDHIFYTGPIDGFYNYQYGRLGYRTVFWEEFTHLGDYQGNAVINYPNIEVGHTRVIEHKHFAPWESHDASTISREYSKETAENDIPYYPKRLERDMGILKKYAALANTVGNVSFLGRLATYRYLDMDKVIEEAFDFSREFIFAAKHGKALPKFPASAGIKNQVKL